MGVGPLVVFVGCDGWGRPWDWVAELDSEVVLSGQGKDSKGKRKWGRLDDVILRLLGRSKKDFCGVYGWNGLNWIGKRRDLDIMGFQMCRSDFVKYMRITL